LKTHKKAQKTAIFTTPNNTPVLGPFLTGPKTDPNLAYFNKKYKLNKRTYKFHQNMIKILKTLKKAYFWSVRKKWLKPAISRGSRKHTKNCNFRVFLQK
jgi:hypothetical protein